MSEFLNSFFADAFSSDIFAGGIALGLIGVGATVAGLWGRRALRMLWRRITISVTVDNRSPAFKFLCLWLEQGDHLSRSRRLQVTQFAEGDDWRPTEDARILMVPSEGRHIFLESRILCILDRSIERKARTESFSGQDGPLEALKFTLLGGGVEAVQNWIEIGAKIAATRDRIGPGIHTLARHGWSAAGDVPRRSLASIVTEGDEAEALLADVRWFYASRDWYASRGVPWRRGYLLYGPPGTGKSSLIRAIASELGSDIATLDLNRSTLSDDALRDALGSVPKNALIAFEDIDAVNAAREGSKTGVSFSGLLNAIDGVAAQEGRALFMTTNHRERLDPALIRPGRADMHVELGPIGLEAAAEMFARFFPDAVQHAETFTASFGDRRIIPAVLQGWLLRHHDDPATAARIDRIDARPEPAEASLTS